MLFRSTASHGSAPEPIWTLPDDLPLPPEEIGGHDPRFRRFLAPGVTLADAHVDQSISKGTAAEIFARMRQIAEMPLEDAVQDLVFSACSGDPTHASRTHQLPISLENGWREALTARFGLDGSSPVTLDEAAKSVPSKRKPAEYVTRERVRQQCEKLGGRIPRPAWIPALTRALQMVILASPVPVDEVGHVLAPRGLSNSQFHADALMSIVELIGMDVEGALGTKLAIRDGWLYDVRDEAVLSAAGVAGRHTSKYGLTTVEEVRQELSSENASLDLEKVERVLSAAPRISWTEDGWLWDSGGDVNSLHTNTLRNHVRNMLSVNAPQSVHSVYEGFRRAQKFRERDIIPSVGAVAKFLSAHPEFTVTDGQVDLVAPLDYHDALGAVAAQVVDILKASPFGVMDRASFVEQCTAAGISKGSVGVWTTYAEWMQSFGRNVWGLRGTAVGASVVEEIQAAAVRRGRSEPRDRSWSWSQDGQLLLTADINTSLWTTGVINFSSSLRHTVGARRFAIEHVHGSGGDLALSGDHDWAWGWGRSLLALKAQVGDRVRATLDLTVGTAWVEVIKGPARTE